MDALESERDGGLLRGVGARQASITANTASRTRLGGPSKPSGANSSPSPRNKNRHAASDSQLAPLTGQCKLSQAAAIPASAVASLPLAGGSAQLTSRGFVHSEQADVVARLPSLALHGRFVASVWRETRALAAHTEQTRQQQLRTLRQTQQAAIKAAEEHESASPAASPAAVPIQPADASAAAAHRPVTSSHRPSFIFPGAMQSIAGLAASHAQPSPTAAAALAAATAAATAPAADATLVSIDSLLNKHSLVHVAASLSIDELQRRENARMVGTASVPRLRLENLLPAGHPSAAQQYGSQSARSFVDHSASAASIAPSSARSIAHTASSRSRVGGGMATSHIHVAPIPVPDSPSAAPSPFLRYAQALQGAWQHQLAFLAQSVFFAKCSDLRLAPSPERRDRFVARILEGAQHGASLRLVAQGLGRASARAVAQFLRRVHAFAQPMPEEKWVVHQSTLTKPKPNAKTSIEAARRRAQLIASGHSGHALSDHASARRGGDQPLSGDQTPQDASVPGSAGESSSDEDEEEEDGAAGGTTSAAAGRNTTSAGDPPMDDDDSRTPGGYARPLKEEDEPDAFNFDAALASSSSIAAGGDVSALIRTMHSRGLGSLAGGGAGSEHLLDVAEGNENEGERLPPPEEEAHFRLMAEAEKDHSAVLLRARRCMALLRRGFHTLDLSSNALSDAGVLELSTLFLPSPKQLAADAAAAALSTQSKAAAKAERRRRRRERRSKRAQARREGRDPDAEEAAQALAESAADDALAALPGLTRVILRSNNVTPQGFALLFDSLAHTHAPLQMLDLGASSSVNSNAVSGASATSSSSSGGSSIGLGQMILGLEGGHSLSRMLSRNHTLHSLLLHNVNMGSVEGSVRFLASGLRNNKGLKMLDISANRIQGVAAGGNVAAEFSELMSALGASVVETLIISSNPIGSLGAAALGTLISSPSCALTLLRAEECSLGAAGLALLTAALASSPRLADVYLERNAFTGSALEKELHHVPLARILVAQSLLQLCVAPALGENLSLHSLHLDSAGMDDRSVSDLAAALERHCTLHTLSLRSNRITDSGGAALGTMLRSNHVLENLDLRMCFIGDAGGVGIAQSLQAAGKKSSLRLLNLENNNLGDLAAAHFHPALLACPNLTALKIEGNRIGFTLFDRISQAAGANKAAQNRGGGAGGQSRSRSLLCSLLRDKAKFTDVLAQRDQAAVQDRRSSDYLASLTGGRKAHAASELRATEEMASSLSKLKLDTLEIQSNIRGVSQVLVAETQKREMKVQQAQMLLDSERTQVRLLRKRLQKESSVSVSLRRGASVGGWSEIDQPSASPSSSPVTTGGGAAQLMFSFSAAADAAKAAVTSSSSSALAPSVQGDVALSNAEAVLRGEKRKVEVAQHELAAALGDVSSFIGMLETALKAPPALKALAGSSSAAGPATARGASDTRRAAKPQQLQPKTPQVSSRRVAPMTPASPAGATRSKAAPATPATPASSSSAAQRGRSSRRSSTGLRGVTSASSLSSASSAAAAPGSPQADFSAPASPRTHRSRASSRRASGRKPLEE